MNEVFAAETISCFSCGATAPEPPHDGYSWQPLADLGWRWRGECRNNLKFLPDTWLFACPRHAEALGRAAEPKQL